MMYDLTFKQIADIISTSVLSLAEGPFAFIPVDKQSISSFEDCLLYILEGDKDLTDKIFQHVSAIEIGMRSAKK